MIRSHLPTHWRFGPDLLLAHLLAQNGFHVVLQECRGRYASEGRFTPFAQEAGDGRDAIDWIAGQTWFDGHLGLAGVGYAGFCAWAALGSAPRAVTALCVASAARDPYAVLYRGGALALDVALRFGLTLGERALVPERRLDLERAALFLPLREADRVAHRQLDWFRDWLDHPQRDAFWQGLVPPLPDPPPPTFLFGCWNDAALGAQLADWDIVNAACARRAAPLPELSIAPGSHAFAPFRAGTQRAWLRGALTFLERRLDRSEAPVTRVRVFVGGAKRWWTGSQWPPPGANSRAYHLHSGGHANGSSGDGRLADEPANAAAPPDRFTYDPANPVATCGRYRRRGRGLAVGCASRSRLEGRPDVLCYTTEPLDHALELCGPVHALLFVDSSAPSTDFTAEILDVRPDGGALDVCDGVLRCGIRGSELPGAPAAATRLEVELGSACHRFGAGHRLRLQVSSSNFPRFDRHPNTGVEPARADASDFVPARQTVFHDAERPSQLVLTVFTAAPSPSRGGREPGLPDPDASTPEGPCGSREEPIGATPMGSSKHRDADS